MSIEQLTYSQIAKRLSVSTEAARAVVKRQRLPRSRANDGKTLVAIDLEEIRHKPLPARSPRGHHPVTDAVAELDTKIKILEAALAAEQKRSAGHREDFERERGRVDQLLSELMTATSDLMSARTMTARLEGELTALGSQQQQRGTSVPTVVTVVARPWWRRLVG
jgi:hypothetical protein